jgi:hypothetical protein
VVSSNGSPGTNGSNSNKTNSETALLPQPATKTSNTKGINLITTTKAFGLPFIAIGAILGLIILFIVGGLYWRKNSVKI